MFEMGNCTQVTKEMQRYGTGILGVSEMRWNSCGKLMRATTGHTLRHSPEGHRVEPKGEAQERQTPAHLEAHKNGRVGGETAHVKGS